MKSTGQHNFQTYLVGGAVRDTLLGFPVKEKDYVVVGAEPEDLVKRGYRPVGQDFPVFLHPDTGEEYALARTERKSGHGYRGFTCYSNPDVSLEEDLKRRDLTINAIAQTEDGQLIDPYSGKADIEARILRHVSPAFCEDPVRILRVARFAARFHHLGFRIAKETHRLMKSMVDEGEANHLTPERVWKELERALKEKSPHTFFDVLSETGALSIALPFVDNTGNHSASIAARDAIERAAAQNTSAEARLASYCLSLPNSEEALSQSLNLIKAPKEFRDIAVSAKRGFVHLQERPVSAEALAQIFQKTDVLRRPDRLKKCTIAWAAQATPYDSGLEVFIAGAVSPFTKINTENIKKRYPPGPALGHALAEARLRALKDYVSAAYSESDH